MEAVIAGIKKIVARPEVEESQVLLSDITSNAMVVLSDYYTASVTINEFNTVKQEINLQALKLLEELQLEMAGACADIRIIGNQH